MTDSSSDTPPPPPPPVEQETTSPLAIIGAFYTALAAKGLGSGS